MCISVASAGLGARLFVPWVDELERIEAMKNFDFKADGPDELVVWFTQTLAMMKSAGWAYGTAMPDGTTRYCTNTNGGPLFVYVKADKVAWEAALAVLVADGASPTQAHVTTANNAYTTFKGVLI